MRIRCTLYDGPKLARDQDSKACQWSSRVVHPEEAIVENQVIIHQINDDHSWLRDFYSMLWDNRMKTELYLHIELMVKENPYKGGTFRNLYVEDPKTNIQEYTVQAATIIKCNNFDGTIRYGSYELPFYKAPLDRANPKNNKELPYIVKVTVGQPVNQSENINDDLFNGKKNVSYFSKPENFKDNTDFLKHNPNAENSEPFIPNTKGQIQNQLFKDDVLILYIDGARFLPENVTFSR